MKTLSGKPISSIGIGSYGIGGRGHRDMPITEKLDDQVYIDALVYTLNNKINFTEISAGYGHGQSLVLFKRALDKSDVSRDDVFITHSLYPRDLPSLEIIKQDIDKFHEIMDTNYADSTLVTQSLLMKFGENRIYELLEKLLDAGKTRYVSLSNASPNWIQKFKQQFKEKFIAHEGHLSFEIRALQDKGVFDICNKLGVKNVIWRPLRRKMTTEQKWNILLELSTTYKKTQSQIILNWICKLGYHPMVFSTNIKHIAENIEATNFTMSEKDYQRMTDFRPPNFNPPSIDWEGTRIDDDIVGLVNEFEKYSKSKSNL